MTSKYKLKNGLKVVLVESSKSPVVSVHLWVNTGSADEKKGQEGLSHFIEHLVFKGTEKFKVGEMATAVEGAGGEMNAYTTFDQTVFHVTISKEHLDVGLNVISQMMGFPSFDKSEIDNEREVVIEEIKRSLDNPRAVAGKLLFSTMYKKHPYGIPVIGYEDNIRNVTRDQIVKYFQTRYTPSNMTLFVVGDFNKKTIKSDVAKYFTTFRNFKTSNIKRTSEIKGRKGETKLEKSKYHESYVYVSWPTPKIDGKDIPELTLLSAILGEGDSSRLVQKIKKEKQLVHSIGSFLFTAKDEGFFTIAIVATENNLERVFTEMAETLTPVLNGSVTDEELVKAKQALSSEKLYSMETVDGLAGLYGHFEFFYKDYSKITGLLKKINRVQAKDLARVAKKYLHPKFMGISGLLGEKIPVEENIFVRARSAFKNAYEKKEKGIKKSVSKKIKVVDWKPRPAKQKDVEVTTLSNGTKVIIKQLVGSPVISVRAGALGGLRLEPQNLNGINELSSRVWPTGTESLSEADYNKTLEGIASNVSAFGGRNTIGLSMTSLVPYAKKCFQVFGETLVSPRIEKEIIQREMKQMVDQLQARKDKPAQICMRKLTEKFFEHHPYSADPLGTPETLSKVKRENILEYLHGRVTTNNLVVSLVGDFNKDQYLKELESWTNRLPKSVLKKENFSVSDLDKNTKIFEFSDKQQAHLALVYPGLNYFDKDRYALDVIQSMLSGQGGRLFVELRDKASLAYTVTPLRSDGLERGYFGAYIGCSPEKSKTAYEMMKKELLRLGEELPAEEEVEKAVRYLIGRHDISWQRTGTIADAYLFDELYGLGVHETDMYVEKIKSVTALDIQSLARRLFSKPFLLVNVGKEDVSI